MSVLKIPRWGLTAVLIYSSLLFSKYILLDDHEDGTNSNELENYWYYYDDNTGIHEYDRPQADPASTPSVIDVPYTERLREAFGNPDDSVTIKDYSFTCNEEAGNKYATMPFILGNSWTTTSGTALPYVGIVTMP